VIDFRVQRYAKNQKKVHLFWIKRMDKTTKESFALLKIED